MGDNCIYNKSIFRISSKCVWKILCSEYGIRKQLITKVPENYLWYILHVAFEHCSNDN